MRFSASRIATLLGHFGADQRQEAILEVWQRANPVSLQRALERKQVVPIQVPERVELLLQQPCTTPQQVAERKVQVQEALKSEPAQPAPIAKALREHAEREINTGFGIVRESPVVQRFEAQFGQAVQLDPQLYVKEFGKVVLQGKIDGRLADGRILEVKNRVRGLFHTVRRYEMMQVQTYLELLDAPSAILCEAYRDQLAWHEVARDTDWFNQHVLEPLSALHDQLSELWTDAEMQDKLFEGKLF